MAFIVTTSNYFNFSGIFTQIVFVSKNSTLVLVFFQLLGVIPLSHPRFVVLMDRAVRAFRSATRCPGQRFPSVPRYMLGLLVFISKGSILFVPCIWLLVCRLHGMIFNCSVNSRSPSFSLVTSIFITLLGVIRSLPRTQLCCFQYFGFFSLLSELWSPYSLSSFY